MREKDGLIYRGWYRTTKNGEPITIVTGRTKEEDKKHYELYGKSLYLADTFLNRTTKEALKNVFTQRFIKLVEQIDKNYTPYWLALNTGLDRTTIIKILSGEHLPSMVSFVRIYKWLTFYYSNLNFWYLLIIDEPMYTSEETTKI